jgi:hypothetical protein
VSTLITGGGLDLNDGVFYWLLGLDIGEPVRDQVWLEPRGNPRGILAADDNRKAQMTLVLRVKANSQTQLITKVEAVRNEFSAADNTLTWGIGGGSGTRKFVTRPSPIPPVPMVNSGDDVPLVEVGVQFLVKRWVIPIWRDPYYTTETSGPPPVI